MSKGTQTSLGIIVARKPLKGTVAENVLNYGTGGLNLDACRVGLSPHENVENLNARSGGKRGFGSASVYGKGANPFRLDMSKGRWPTNLVLLNLPCVLKVFPEGRSAYPGNTEAAIDHAGKLGQRNVLGTHAVSGESYADSGSAARFFKQVDP